MPTPSPVDKVVEKEERRAVQEALASLPDAQREAIVLRYYENLSYAEIGQVIGKSRKGVERLLARGRSALAARLGRRLGNRGFFEGDYSGARRVCSFGGACAMNCGAMKCDRVRNLMDRYVCEELSPEERLSFEVHLADCQACQQQLTSLHQPGDDAAKRTVAAGP